MSKFYSEGLTKQGAWFMVGNMAGHWWVVVVSRRSDVTRKISAIFEPWGLDVISCSQVKQAREVFTREMPRLVYCDDLLSDGTYRDLLDWAKNGHSANGLRVVVLPSVEASLEPDFETEALTRGAYAVLGLPPQDVDIEWIAIRAIREDAKRRAAAQN